MKVEASVYVLTFARFVTGFVFAWSGMSKLRDFPAFVRTITNFRVLPNTFVKPAAILFLSGELAVVALMLLGAPFLQAGFGLAALLLVVFSFALLSVLARKLDTPCNCFGATSKSVSHYDVVRNAGLLACALAGLFLSTPHRLEIVESALLALMAVTFSVVWIKLSDLSEVFL